MVFEVVRGRARRSWGLLDPHGQPVTRTLTPVLVAIIALSLATVACQAGSTNTTKPTSSATAGAVRVAVENGTSVEGLAAQAMARLVSRGYPADEMEAANTVDGTTHAESEIIDQDGTHSVIAGELANWLNIAPAHVRTATERERAAAPSDQFALTIVLGSDATDGRFTR